MDTGIQGQMPASWPKSHSFLFSSTRDICHFIYPSVFHTSTHNTIANVSFCLRLDIIHLSLILMNAGECINSVCGSCTHIALNSQLPQGYCDQIHLSSNMSRAAVQHTQGSFTGTAHVNQAKNTYSDIKIALKCCFACCFKFIIEI